MHKIDLILNNARLSEIAEIGIIADALKSSPPVSVRHNPGKFIPDKKGTPVPWCEQGVYLNERPFFAADPLWHSGAYYVQEASSMFAGELLRQLVDGNTPLKALDLCASPGGKSTHLLSILPPDSLLVSNEVMKQRTLPLSDNIQRWGQSRVIVSSSAASDFSRAEGFFDVILADMPCSGEGMVRKDPFALEQWSPGLVSQCSLLQKQLLEEAWKALKPGGIFLYSTCTFNREENEENVDFAIQFLGAVPAKQAEVPAGVILTETGGIYSYRFLPGMIKGEGFFISAFRKPEGPEFVPGKLRKESYPLVKSPEEITFLAGQNDLDVLQKGEDLYLFPSSLKKDLEYLSSFVHVIHPGTRTGKYAGKDFIPDHALALHTGIDQYFQYFDLSLEDARAYLSRETPSSIPAGDIIQKWALAGYKGLPMGWIKKAGNRINNYYPLPLRLRNNLSSGNK